MGKYLIPEQQDWKHLERIYSSLCRKNGLTIDSLLKREKVFGFFPSQISLMGDKNLYTPFLTDDYAKLSRLLLYIARYFWMGCPLPALSAAKNELDIEEFEDYELLSPVLNYKEDTRYTKITFIRLLEELISEGLIYPVTYKNWGEQYGDKARTIEYYGGKVKRSSIFVYPLTALGTLMYEFVIARPQMFESYLTAYFEPDLLPPEKKMSHTRSQNRYNTSVNPLINLSIATRPERLCLLAESPFHLKNNDQVIHQYHEDIRNEQHRLLKDDIYFFAEIHNPATKILREYRCLIEIEKFYDLRIKELRVQYYDALDLMPVLFKKKIDADKALLSDIWVNFLGLDIKYLERSLPEFSI